MIKHSSSWTSQCGAGPKQKGSSSSRRAPTIAYTTSVSFTDDRGPPAPGGRYHDGAEEEHDQAEWAEAGWMGGGGLLNRHSPIITFERLLVRCITPTYTCTYTIICPSFTSASLGHSNQHIIILTWSNPTSNNFSDILHEFPKHMNLVWRTVIHGEYLRLFCMCQLFTFYNTTAITLTLSTDQKHDLRKHYLIMKFACWWPTHRRLQFVSLCLLATWDGFGKCHLFNQSLYWLIK